MAEENITPENAAKMWKAWCALHLPWSDACDEICQCIFEKIQPLRCDEKLKNISREINIDSLDVEGENAEHTDGDILVKITLDSGVFVRPDKYHAECVRQKVNNGEKCNSLKIDMLKTQILCDIILSNKCGKVYLFVDTKGKFDVALELACFLQRHKMYPRIYLKARLEDNAEYLAQACFSSPERVLVTPFLTSPTDECEQAQFKRFLTDLAAVYPIGAAMVIGKM